MSSLNFTVDDDNHSSFGSFSTIKTSTDEYMTVAISLSDSANISILLIKNSNEGEYLWHTDLDMSSYGGLSPSITETSDNNFLVAHTYGFNSDNNFSQSNMALQKINAEGNLLWSKMYEAPPSSHPLPIRLTASKVFEEENEFYFFGSQSHINNCTVLMIKTDAEGNEISRTSYQENPIYGTTERFTQLNDGNFVVAILVNDSISLTKIDSQGEPIWSHSYWTNYTNYRSDIEGTPDGGLIIAGNVENEQANGIEKYPFLIKLDSNGELEWRKAYENSVAKFEDIIVTSDEEYLVGGVYVSSVVYIAKIDSLGNIYTQKVFGNIFHDADLSCDLDNDELPKENWFIQLDGVKDFYAISDTIGNYCAEIDTGEYEISLIPPSTYWESCQPSYNISVDLNDTIDFNLPAQAIVNCPFLEIDISTPFLRRCFENDYSIRYCNNGTVAATDAYVEVAFDEFLSVNSSSIPSLIIDSLSNTFQFELGNIAVGECGSFRVNFTVDCDSTILGQTHCTTAQIFPNDYCFPPDSLWDGSSIEVSGSCDGDSVTFRITNVGIEDMTEELEYLVIEDQLMLRQGNFKLNSGEDSTFTFLPNGSTMRLIAEQANAHPGNSMPTVAVEGCGSFPFGTGYVTAFGEDDGNPFISIDCQENRGSYDPNDKQGFPKGYGDDFFIDQNIEIEYLIRFQNTGTDTAFKVVVVDTLSWYLDPVTFKPGASSHPYSYQLKGQGIIEFTFDNILLPDSTTNLPGSNGFIKFKVDQKKDNPIGTIINNEAAIYFDFNDPIITNQTKHTIGEDFIDIIINTTDLDLPNVDLKIYPNPFTHSATIEIIDGNYDEVYFKLFDTQGKLIRQTLHKENRFSFERKQLPAGVYFFLIETEKGLLRNGKMIIQ